MLRAQKRKPPCCGSAIGQCLLPWEWGHSCAPCPSGHIMLLTWVAATLLIALLLRSKSVSDPLGGGRGTWHSMGSGCSGLCLGRA